MRKIEAPKSRTVTIGLTGKYASVRDAYASIVKTVEHCATHLECTANLEWIESSELAEESISSRLAGCDAVIVPGGFGSRGVEGKIACVKHCRVTGLPFLGICLGFQCAVIEFARNVVGLKEANSTEFDPNCPQAVISELPDQKKIEQLGGTMRLGGQDVAIQPSTLAHYLYGKDLIRQRFRHRYEVEPLFIERLEAGGLVFSGRHPQHRIMQILELPAPGEAPEGIGHPYFIAAQFHPELLGRPLRPEPMFMGLLAAALQRKYPGPGQQARWARSEDAARVD
jgi:CTP synthase